MTRMFNPAHPGKVLREYISKRSIAEAAAHLGMTRAALSRILDGSEGISADTALRLEEALGISAEMWLDMQLKYELWEASRKPRRDIKPLAITKTWALKRRGRLNAST